MYRKTLFVYRVGDPIIDNELNEGEGKMKKIEQSIDKDTVRVTEIVDLPEEEQKTLWNGEDSEHYKFIDIIDSGYSHGYDRALVVIRKHDKEEYYRFMVISYHGIQTFTQATRVYPEEITHTRVVYNSSIVKKVNE